MAFCNVVCWNSGRVRDVMNTNAELAQRDIFLAVHSEFPLTICNPGTGDLKSAPRWIKGPHQFLQEFLSSEQRHIQVAVLGNSGSGKSHFIRWMGLNIPTKKDRYLINVPRAGISLRGVIDLVLAALPDEQAHPYREQLDQAGFQRATRTDLHDRLISAIAHAIREDAPAPDGDQDLESDLIEQLPNLFHDPALRPHYKKPGGVVEQLVNQVLSASTAYVPVEERRTFALANLPLTAVQPQNLSEPTRKIIDSLRPDVEIQQLAVEIINRNLDKAIRQMMNFTGDRLIQLFTDVRRYLRTQRKELILLVEDLARLQGLDLALLDALIEEGREDNGLCTLRWAAAVTTGYYASLPDTVKTRMTFVLDMDLSTGGEKPIVDDDGLVAFASRYLNAVRLPPEELKAWAANPEVERSDPPVVCESCNYRQVCHAAFGSEQGIGLYPFNRLAILNMLHRLDPQLDQRFNPRLLVKDVLAEVFATYRHDLEVGQFPSSSLLDQMGGQKLPPVVLSGLRQRDPEHAARQIALIELWGAKGAVPTELPEDLYSAFGLPKPVLGEVIVRETVDEPKHLEQPGQRGDPVVEAIRAWGNGHRMRDDLLNTVRPLVYESMASRIDWDNEGLVQAQFASATGGLFLRDSITFVDQQTQPRLRPVGLRIPLNDAPADREIAAVALEGLYLFRQYGNWNFQNGPSLLAALANRLDEWCAHVIKQLKQLPDAKSKWDPAVSAIEVLAVGAAMAGRLTHASVTLPELLNALFEEWPQEISAQSPEWRTLCELIRKEQPRLRNVAIARATGSKGGQRGAFIDPSKVLPTLSKVHRGWELAHQPPEGSDRSPGDYAGVSKIYSKVAAGLRRAAEAEWHRRTVWVEDWRKVVPEGTTRKDIIDGVRALVKLTIEHGIQFSPRIKGMIEEAVVGLEGVQLDAALQEAERLRGATNPLLHLPELGRDRGGNAVAAVTQFLPAIHNLLDELEASVSNRMELRGQGAKDIQEHQSRIREALGKLSQDLNLIGGSNANSD